MTPVLLLRQLWASETGHSIVFCDGVIEGKDVNYPMILGTDGDARVDLGNEFLLWYSQQPKLQQEAIKSAQKWLTCSANIERHKRKLSILTEGIFNSHMEVRVAAKQCRREHGSSSIAGCRDMSTRADHLIDFDEMTRMMHICFSGDGRVHPNPLRVLQAGLEVRITHATGVRGQLVRSAKFEHLWPRDYKVLAGRKGLRAIVMSAHLGSNAPRAHHHTPPHLMPPHDTT